jgi:hypothetical protein
MLPISRTKYMMIDNRLVWCRRRRSLLYSETIRSIISIQTPFHRRCILPTCADYPRRQRYLAQRHDPCDVHCGAGTARYRETGSQHPRGGELVYEVSIHHNVLILELFVERQGVVPGLFLWIDSEFEEPTVYVVRDRHIYSAGLRGLYHKLFGFVQLF